MSDPTQTTRSAYIATRVLDTPFWALYNMIPVILYKDLQALPWQLALVIALKPLVSVLSTYWSSWIDSRRDRLKANIIWARTIGYLPFFFIPFFHSTWFLIFAFGLYMMLAVGIVPAWMELLRINIPHERRAKLFSYTQAFGYIGGGLFPFLLGYLLDSYSEAWRWLFPIAGTIGLSAFFFQRKMTAPENAETILDTKVTFGKPWRSAFKLLQERPDFLLFQLGFMIVASALMIVQPILPIFFVDKLQLSYMEISIALTFCKGLGFVSASPFFARAMNNIGIYRLTGFIALTGALFPLFLLLSPFQIAWLYIAYFIYGVMQSGSEMVWNLSGPYFAHNADSSRYTSVNVIAVGVRGACIPMIGSFLGKMQGSSFVMATAMTLFLIGGYALFLMQQEKIRRRES